MHITIEPIKSFNDNYIWVIKNTATNNTNKATNKREITLVDPGEFDVVHSYCDEQNLHVKNIFVTHRHSDHIGAVAKLQEIYGSEVYSPIEISGCNTNLVSDGEVLHVFGGEFIIMSTPGHTNEHISFYSPTFNSLFCGDTLFSGGCGRVFDGNYEDLFCSLKKFTNLRSETKVYCAHEYTINNLEFALKYTDNNKNIEARLEECKELITKQLPTVPSTIKIELDSNIFFFCHNKHKDIFAKEIKNAESMKRVDIFKYLREKKNNF